tara:strand:+ start:2024 stop:2995 length:972 start_codon:yes stop_codon:yes gene_type:complete
MFIDNRWYVFICALFALVFSIYLAILPIDSFIDRDNYLSFASTPELFFFHRLNDGYISFVFNEPLWAITNIALRTIFDTENTLRVIIFLSSFSTFYIVLKNIPQEYFFLGLLFLLLPQVLKNNVIQLRQGFAIALFLWGYFSKSNKIRLLFFVSAALVHSSFIIIIPCLFFITLLSKYNFSNGIKGFLFTAISLSIGVGALSMASVLGARQAEGYENYTSNASGLGFIFWGCFLMVYILQGNTFLKRNVASLFFMILYLSTYFFLPVTARIFESVLIIILLSSIELKSWNKIYFYFLYVFYFIFTWVDRLFLPGFGWDIINYQ